MRLYYDDDVKERLLSFYKRLASFHTAAEPIFFSHFDRKMDKSGDYPTSPSISNEGPVKPLRPVRPIRPVKPLRPVRPVRPIRPLRPVRPLIHVRPLRHV